MYSLQYETSMGMWLNVVDKYGESEYVNLHTLLSQIYHQRIEILKDVKYRIRVDRSVVTTFQ